MKATKLHHLASRRNFLKSLAAGGGATALLVANASPLVDGDRPLTPVADDEPSRGYRLTSHIRDYYRTLG